MRTVVGKDRPDHYTVLGLTPGASSADVTRAYRALVRALHPDTQAHADRSGSTRELRFDAATPPSGVPSQDALRGVMDAYGVLGDPARRAAYDHEVVASPAHPGPDVAIRVNHTHRVAPASIKEGPVRWHQ
ncbi:MAG: J domain-containing protein [Ornithinibacter sp.]